MFLLLDSAAATTHDHHHHRHTHPPHHTRTHTTPAWAGVRVLPRGPHRPHATARQPAWTGVRACAPACAPAWTPPLRPHAMVQQPPSPASPLPLRLTNLSRHTTRSNPDRDPSSLSALDLSSITTKKMAVQYHLKRRPRPCFLTCQTMAVKCQTWTAKNGLWTCGRRLTTVAPGPA